MRARNYRGEEGFVPQNYLDVEREPETQSGLVSQPGLVQQISFSSVDYTVDDHDAVDPDLYIKQESVENESIVQNHVGMYLPGSLITLIILNVNLCIFNVKIVIFSWRRTILHRPVRLRCHLRRGAQLSGR